MDMVALGILLDLPFWVSNKQHYLSMVAYLGDVVDTAIILLLLYDTNIMSNHAVNKRKLDRLMSESKGATNKTPTYVVPTHDPQTKALCRGVGQGR